MESVLRKEEKSLWCEWLVEKIDFKMGVERESEL